MAESVEESNKVLTEQIVTLPFRCNFSDNTMATRIGFAPVCTLAALSAGVLFFANADGTKKFAMASLGQVAQQACNPSTQRCCFNPDGTPVPPGTRRGPYTCLPNGTWG